MKFYLIIILLVQVSYSFDLPKNAYEADVTINGDHYNVSDVYHIGEAYPVDTHYDKYGNLFFIECGRNLEGYFFDAKIVKANSTISEKVSGLPDGLCYSLAVDKNNSKVYFGTGEGIYEYNYESEDTRLISSPEIKANDLFLDKDGNKYITESPEGEQELYLLSGEKKIRFKTLDALNEAAVDDENNIYFIKEEKLFVLKSNLSFPIFVGNVTYDGLAQISFHKNIVYVASNTLFYLHENETGSLKNVENVPANVTAVAFDYESNFVLGTYGKIVKYEHKNSEC